ncbi:Rossmann-like and DUF2520 domain-containing protein [Ralstonia flatus]|uniref:NADP oxidoreductase n=2 Tax=Ralstonia TaxID=48736 RepID=A0AAD2C6I4_9RALS|nr:DUF2520 domain-containing protein [Ralstonia sp. LMG 32965]MBN6210597.1 DUF2520 domain-containing protein [Ralstonia pickettii]CAJ0867639.1 hypothetical protein R77567_02132 [Ralstonia sp. LMG 32965]CAJ0879446.1 hypothetical protein R77564_02483 [Ralstonia sp. LMG 32965]
MTSFAIEAPVSVGWIGTGRLARALATRAHDAGVRTVAVANRSAAAAAWLAQATGAKAVDAQGVADAADWVFVTVPDDAIPGVVGNVRWRPGQLVLHCSGAGERNLLDAARQAGAETASFHPLFLFAGLPDDAERLGGASIAIDADAPHDAALASFALRLGCTPLKVRAGQRALYHAGANYAASFLLCALHEAATLWEAAGIDRDAAVAAMWPLVDGTLAAARARGLAGALAGPVSRGDGGVIDKHLQALDALGADHATLYAALTRRALALAAERGAPSADVLSELAARLNPT